MLTRRTALVSGAALLAAPAIRHARAADGPLKIGNTMPYSGPASAYSPVGKASSGFFKWVNDQGGVAGRQIDFISLDDSYSPPKTVEQVRRLVEKEKVAFLFNTLGTASNSAIRPYCNQRKIPQLFVSSGADKWGDYKDYPWTIGWAPSYRVEAQIYAKYMLKENPKAKLGILYQNDDFGKDYPAGVRDVLGKDWDNTVIASISYEVTDATADSQITSLKSAGADTILAAATPKFAAQIIRKVHNLGWKPMFFLTNVSTSVGAVIQPAGVENAVGVISTQFRKDPSDPAWDNDAGMREFKAFMAKYLPGADITDSGYMTGYGYSYTMWKVLEACNGDFSRPSVMKQATSIHEQVNPALLPGLRVNTSPTNYHPVLGLQTARWDGKSWARFGEIIMGVAES